MIIYSDNSAHEYYPRADAHQHNDEKVYSIYYFLPERQNDTPYTKGLDIIVPSVANGCMYECASSGTSAASYADFPTLEEQEHGDGDVAWKCLPLTTRLDYGDTITASEWSASDGVILTTEAIVSGIATKVKVTAVPVDAITFTLTNKVSVTRLGGGTEVLNKTLIIPVIASV